MARCLVARFRLELIRAGVADPGYRFDREAAYLEAAAVAEAEHRGNYGRC